MKYATNSLAILHRCVNEVTVSCFHFQQVLGSTTAQIWARLAVAQGQKKVLSFVPLFGSNASVYGLDYVEFSLMFDVCYSEPN